MRAIVLGKLGGLASLAHKDIPKREPKAGQVAIHIKGFGINHAEMRMRRGKSAAAAEGDGTECVGVGLRLTASPRRGGLGLLAQPFAERPNFGPFEGPRRGDDVVGELVGQRQREQPHQSAAARSAAAIVL